MALEGMTIQLSRIGGDDTGILFGFSDEVDGLRSNALLLERRVWVDLGEPDVVQCVVARVDE